MERSWCRNIKLIVSNDWFDYAVAGLIFVNCVFLALDDPTREASPAHNHEKSPPRWLQISDVIFTSLFVLEMGMKLVALGFHYFVDVWNWLDAIVVVEGVFSVFFDGALSVKSLRALRVLRPLRTVRRMPRVQLVVTSLFRAGWTLGQIICIFLVWLTIFAILGVLLWSGRFNNRCVVPSSPEYYGDQVCGIPVGKSDNLPAFCASLELLDQPYTCGDGEICVDYGTSPYSGMVNFDNLLWSLLTLFTVTTLEGWHEVSRVCPKYS
ncbi:unnamed protein product [Ascophyllum nodosum]